MGGFGRLAVFEDMHIVYQKAYLQKEALKLRLPVRHFRSDAVRLVSLKGKQSSESVAAWPHSKTK